MDENGFEWDDDKAARNLLDHKVTFDEREDYGEERSCLLGRYGRDVLFVSYTERGSNIRIISARRAERHEQDHYYHQNPP